MEKWKFTKGLHDVGKGIYAYLQPDGGWGWNNAGLICDGDQTLLVDTLFDGTLTQEMLNTMRDAVPAAANIDTLVNTHANGDHCFGNGLVTGAEIIASKASADEMEELPPQALAGLMAAAPNMGQTGQWMLDNFSAFDFTTASLKMPTRTFEKELKLKVGNKQVNLLEVGPAHTKGDVIVEVPQDRVVFTGDILFNNDTPIIWEGPIGNWIRACERILDMDVEVVVPGHGALTDKSGVARTRDYFVALERETRKRYDAGLSIMDAAVDIKLDGFDDFGYKERTVTNVATLYREFSGDTETLPIPKFIEMMADLAFRLKAQEQA